MQRPAETNKQADMSERRQRHAHRSVKFALVARARTVLEQHVALFGLVDVGLPAERHVVDLEQSVIYTTNEKEEKQGGESQ